MALAKPKFEKPLMLIDGELVESQSGERFKTHNPSNGEELATIPDGNSQDIDLAVNAAHDAFQSWSREYTSTDRSEMLFDLADLVRDNVDNLAAIDAADSGNPISEMRRDLNVAADTLDMYGGLAKEIKGETIPVDEINTLNYTVEQPYGVVARIVAYNHPTRFAVAKIAAPLVTGNTVVIKPPEQDSTGVLELGRLIQEHSIFPDGVVNIVSGFGKSVGDPLVRHKKVKKVGFTGSVETGKIVEKAAADSLTGVLSELGGKNPGIIFPDTDLHNAIKKCVDGMNFTWCGQSCGSITRVFIHEDQYDEALELLKNEIESIEPGDPLDWETDMGCLVSQKQLEKVQKYIELGKTSGARLITGGSPPSGDKFKNGNYLRPTLFADVEPDMRIAQEELFGPVCFVFKWSDEEKMIETANNVDYGLTGCVFTDDLHRAHRVSQELQAGFVWINHAGPHYLGAPFGGWKESGNGREEALSELFEFTQTKNINIKYNNI